MRKLTIAFGDLNYLNDWNLGTIFVPLSIANIAAYCEKMFGTSVSTSLHKDADSLLNSVDSDPPDIVALSFYHWNTSLNRVVLRQIRRKLGDRVVLCLGGPSIDSDHEEHERLFREFSDVDAFVINEGEAGFSNLVERVLASSNPWEEPIDGVVFQKDRQCVRGLDIGLSTNLAELVSPYLSGMLDPFLNASFLPIIQTSRLCPYTCTFCASGKNSGKLRGFPMDIVNEELTYVAKKYRDHAHLVLNLADDNFGILKRDVEIARHIRKTADTFGYPQGLRFYSDKNFGETSKHVVDILGDLNKYGANFSLQTQTKDSLNQIKRKNLRPEKLEESIAWARSKNLTTSTEFIFGLPGESLDSFVPQLTNAIELGFSAVNCGNLMILDGTEMRRKSFKELYKHSTKFRINGSNYGDLGGEFSVESEEIVVSSDKYSYEEFVKVRILMIMFYAIFTLQFYSWFFLLLRHVGIPIVDFILKFTAPNNLDSWPKAYQQLVTDLNRDVQEEFFDSIEELENYAREMFTKGNIDNRKLNVYYGARLAFKEREWTQDVLLRHIEESYADDLTEDQFDAIRTVLTLCDRERINLRTPVKPGGFETSYDFLSWRKDNCSKDIINYKIEKSLITLDYGDDALGKIENYAREFESHNDDTFYYLALEMISPRSDTLFKPTCGEVTTIPLDPPQRFEDSFPTKDNQLTGSISG